MSDWNALCEFLRTDPRDVGCDLALDALHVYVEVAVAGENPRSFSQGWRHTCSRVVRAQKTTAPCCAQYVNSGATNTADRRPLRFATAGVYFEVRGMCVEPHSTTSSGNRSAVTGRIVWSSRGSAVDYFVHCLVVRPRRLCGQECTNVVDRHVEGQRHRLGRVRRLREEVAALQCGDEEVREFGGLPAV
jgi:hypothetical protein